MLRFLSVLTLLILISCSPRTDTPQNGTRASQTFQSEATATSTSLADYLFVWSRNKEREQTDFFSVFNVDPESEQYGQLVSTVPMGVVANAHHTEHFMSEGNRLFMNGFMSGNSFVVNVTNPQAPVIDAHFTKAGPYTYPHSFERLPNGNVLATFQNKGAPDSGAGGLVELDPLGIFLRGTDAADPVDPELRPYSLAPVPNLDRVVTTTGDMWLKLLGRSVQIWRLSDLTLMKTVLLPPGPRGDENLDVAEARLLDDGRTLIVTTFRCGMYVLSNIQTDHPAIDFVYSFPFEAGDECGLPWRIGHYWIQTVDTTNSLHVLDISDPRRPQLVSELFLGSDELPHWISGELGGNRIALTGSGPWLDGRVVLLELNQTTGNLSVIDDFRSPGSDRPGANMNRETWPHGADGPAVPHGVVFSRPK